MMSEDRPRTTGEWLREEWISIAALLVSLVSAFYAYRAVDLTRQSLKQHLDPELSCQLDNVSDQFPIFAIENVGAIPAESVSVDHLTFRYTKTGRSKSPMAFDLPTSGQPGFRWLYAPKLEPNDRTPPKQTGSFVPPPNSPENKTEIAILLFEISYLRPTDGKRYQKRCVFYKDGDHFERRATFQSNPHFGAVDEFVEQWLGKTLQMRPGLGLRE
jgi:hypothetical protein